MMRILVLASALALVLLAAPAEVSPVGEASANCYYLGDEFGCVNPCNALAPTISRVTGRPVYCLE